jgi:prepilin-type N-terminal cleavage/methylation domain-containing protein
VNTFGVKKVARAMETDDPLHMRNVPSSAKAFTLTELLAVIVIIAVLAALLLPGLGRAKANGRRTACLSNLKQVNQGVRMYADDYNNSLFTITNSNNPTNIYFPSEWTAYVPLIRSYVGLKGAPSPQDKLFACPADTFAFDVTKNSRLLLVDQSIHLLSNWNYSSYLFNAGNAVFQIPKPAIAGRFPGVLGRKLNSIKEPVKTVLVAEYPVQDPFSWHQPAPPGEGFFNNAPNMVGFVDGHVNYVKIYFGSNNPENVLTPAYIYNPPAGYDYKWSGD